MTIVAVHFHGDRQLQAQGPEAAVRAKQSRGLRADLTDKIERILTVLDAASAPQALDLPGYRLHQLKGDRKGYWSVTVRANWRIVFRFENDRACDVDLVDYH